MIPNHGLFELSTTLPNLAVLVFDWTLEDLERFCTDPQEHVVLSVDPTFNLGSFHVTVTTYQHPMLEFRHQRRGNRPVMFGPMFIHQRKTFGTYNFFLYAVGISVHGTGKREPFGDKRDPDPGPSSNPLQCTKLPASIQQSIWAKVQSYLEDESSYSKSPGVNDYTSVLVKSSSSERPHFVTKKSSSYKCDSDCLMFKSTNGLCSHSLLAASLNRLYAKCIRAYALV